jgi:hypothetical protein
MNTRSMTKLAALVLLVELGGCTSMRSHWPFESELKPTRAVPSSHVSYEAPPATEVGRPKRTRSETGRTPTAREQPAPASVPAQSPPRAPAGTTSVTLEDGDADHIQAQALLDDANSRLAQIDRSKLTGENATAYDQASDLANAARKAMDQHDYLAASGLARKAALVTAQVAPRTSSR